MNNRSIVEANNAQWDNALNSGNIKSLVALYAENAIISPGNGKTLVGRVQIENLFKGFIDGGVHNHTLEIIEVGDADKTIFQVARWRA